MLLASQAVALPIFHFIASVQAVFSATQPLFNPLTHFPVIIAHTGFSTINSVHFSSNLLADHIIPHSLYPSLATSFIQYACAIVGFMILAFAVSVNASIGHWSIFLA